MKPGIKNSYKSLTDIKINNQIFKIFSLTKAEENGLNGISKLPKSLKVLLENLLRYEDDLSVNKDQIEAIKECLKEKINLIGICCGAEAHHVREMAVAVGKKPIAMKYMPDMTKHFHHGTDKTLKDVNKEIKY